MNWSFSMATTWNIPGAEAHLERPGPLEGSFSWVPMSFDIQQPKERRTYLFQSNVFEDFCAAPCPICGMRVDCLVLLFFGGSLEYALPAKAGTEIRCFWVINISSIIRPEKSERETPINGYTHNHTYLKGLGLETPPTVQPPFLFEAHINGPIASEARAVWTSGGYIHFKGAIFYNVRVAAAGMPELRSGCFRVLESPGFIMAFTEPHGCCTADLGCFWGGWKRSAESVGLIRDDGKWNYRFFWWFWMLCFEFWDPPGEVDFC